MPLDHFDISTDISNRTLLLFHDIFNSTISQPFTQTLGSGATIVKAYPGGAHDRSQ